MSKKQISVFEKLIARPRSNQADSALLKTLLMLLLILSIQAEANCTGETENTQSQTEGHYEIALANMVIYSQEYMRYFFADNDSEIQPLPASGMSIFVAAGPRKSWRFTSVLTLPLKEEEVRKKDREPFRYYYPKLMMLGGERDLFETKLSAQKSSCLRTTAIVGLALPLSSRLIRYQPPFLLMRASAEVGDNVFLNFGVGYSGNIQSGAWFFPFGVSYVINRTH